MAIETSFITPSDLMPIAMWTVVVGFVYSVAVTIVLSRTIMENFITITVLMGIFYAIIYSLWRALPFLFTRGRTVVGMKLSRDAAPPPGIKQLNKSVWELYSPEGVPEMEIIFVHSLQLGDFRDAFWKTWVTRDNSEVIWPKEWLSREFPKARILSISYNSSVIKSDEPKDSWILGEDFVQDIIVNREYDLGQGSSVFFVGHGFGGIAIKQMIISARRLSKRGQNGTSKRIDKFVENIKGVFYYGTPHGGSMIANVACFIPRVNPLVGILKALDAQMGRLNGEFRSLRLALQIRTFSLLEGSPVPIFKLPFSNRRFGIKLVQEASSKQDSDSCYTAASSNHFTLCKPGSRGDPGFRQLVRFISFRHPNSIDTPGPSNLQ